jgi:aerobic-type carbon monoxide dehydrogenase small subunit (CoxS/CutS family)
VPPTLGTVIPCAASLQDASVFDAVQITLTIDGSAYEATVDPDLSALRAIRDVMGHDRPRVGCEEGRCGRCESKVNGHDTRLCVTPIGWLDGAVVVTPVPRRSIFG